MGRLGHFRCSPRVCASVCLAFMQAARPPPDEASARADHRSWSTCSPPDADSRQVSGAMPRALTGGTHTRRKCTRAPRRLSPSWHMQCLVERCSRRGRLPAPFSVFSGMALGAAQGPLARTLGSGPVPFVGTCRALRFVKNCYIPLYRRPLVDAAPVITRPGSFYGCASCVSCAACL